MQSGPRLPNEWAPCLGELPQLTINLFFSFSFFLLVSLQIDALSKRSKEAENAFLNVYKKIIDVPGKELLLPPRLLLVAWNFTVLIFSLCESDNKFFNYSSSFLLKNACTGKQPFAMFYRLVAT